MKSRTWYKLHKWLAVSVGIFFAMWSISGIIMMLPPGWFLPSQETNPPIIDYHSASVSPAEAISLIEEELGKDVDPISVETMHIHDMLVYKIVLPDFSWHMLNAATGEPVWINETLSEQIARDGHDAQANISKVELIEQHDLLYPFGELPVYRVIFEGDGSNMYYVSTATGNLSLSNNLTRLIAAIVSLHTFEPIRLFTETNSVRKGLLILFAAIGVLTALTGYLLFFLPFIRRKSSPPRVSN